MKNWLYSKLVFRYFFFFITSCIMLSACKEAPKDLCPELESKWKGEFPKHDRLWYAAVNPKDPNEIVANLKTSSESLHRYGLFKINLLTSDTLLLYEGVLNGPPDWGVNDWIVFCGLDWQIHKVKSNGDSLTQITVGAGSFSPSWSPDADKIAFYSYEGERRSAVYTMNNDGSEKKLATDNPLNERLSSIVWSNTGDMIACNSPQGEVAVPYVINLNNGEIMIYPITRHGQTSTITYAWLDNDEALICASPEGVYLLDISTGATLDILPGCENVIYSNPQLLSNSSTVMLGRLLVYGDDLHDTRLDLVTIDIMGGNETLVRLFE